jgi:hypothetical protein
MNGAEIRPEHNRVTGLHLPNRSRQIPPDEQIVNTQK